jgi:hypothetical protein
MPEICAGDKIWNSNVWKNVFIPELCEKSAGVAENTAPLEQYRVTTSVTYSSSNLLCTR